MDTKTIIDISGIIAFIFLLIMYNRSKATTQNKKRKNKNLYFKNGHTYENDFKNEYIEHIWDEVNKKNK